MNTKILISCIALTLLLIQYNSMGASHQKHILDFENPTNAKTPPGNNSSNDVPLDWTINGHHVYQTMGHQTDHDDQTHKFHYDRFHRNRNRIIVILVIKFLLIITHICTFLCASIHLLH